MKSMFLTRSALQAKKLVSASLVMMLLVSGCADKFSQVQGLSKQHTKISQTHVEFSDLADNSDLPVKYISEGKVGLSKIEATFNTADALDVQAKAELNKQMADFGARRSEIQADVNCDMSEASVLREKYNSDYTKTLAQIEAREKELAALVEQKEAIIVSLTKERDTKRSDMITKAREEIDREKARIEQFKEVYKAIETEGNAKIIEMVEASRATRERAGATVKALQTEASSVKQDTQAKVDEINEHIKSVNIQTKAEADRLQIAREAILKDSEARVMELRSKADTMEDNLGQQQYELQLTRAVSEKVEGQAIAQQESANAPTRFEKAMAEINRLRSQIVHQQKSSQAEYEKQFAEVQAKINDELAEVQKLRIKAHRIEQVARAEFISTEAEARAQAVRQTAEHAQTLAEVQKNQIVAQSEAEAAKLKQEMLEELAQKKKSNKVQISGNTSDALAQPADLHKVPAVPQVQQVTPKIEPRHIADFRKSLAKVMRINAQADAYEMVARATFAETKTKLASVKAQKDAIASEQLAIADALEAQATSRLEELEIKTQKEMDIVESKYQQQVVQADTFRKETEADVMDLRAQSDALDLIAHARAEKLLAEANVVLKRGENETKELQVELWAINQRGEAQYARLMTEATSVRDSQEALACQFDAQVDAARRSLSAELAKIDCSINSAEIIAQADYEQSLNKATVLAQKTAAKINRINARFAMEHSIAQAEIQRDKGLSLSRALRGEAVCDRIAADARTKQICGNADIDAKFAKAQADMKIILASNSAKRNSAEVYLTAVKTRFKARVEQVKSERVIDIADAFKGMALKRTDLATALAQAKAAREASSTKLFALREEQKHLQETSLKDWSEKLARFRNVSIQFEKASQNLQPEQLADEILTPETPAVTHSVSLTLD